MKCENVFCIYQSKGECTIEEIGIDATGMCMSCIYVDVDGEILESAKIKLLDEFEKMDKVLFGE